jgi:hypothetical protein
LAIIDVDVPYRIVTAVALAVAVLGGEVLPPGSDSGAGPGLGGGDGGGGGMCFPNSVTTVPFVALHVELCALSHMAGPCQLH